MTGFVTIATVVAAEGGRGRPHDAEAIERALATEGGHLLIGHGSYTIYHAQGWLSGCCPDTVKRMCLAAGLPVIDARRVPFDAIGHSPILRRNVGEADTARIAISGTMVAVGREPSPEPYTALSCPPLATVASLYQAAGADVRNIPKHRQVLVLPRAEGATHSNTTRGAGLRRTALGRLLQRLRVHRP